MRTILIDGLVSINNSLKEAGEEIVRLIDSSAVELIVRPYSEKEAEKRRSNAQNKLIYEIYMRIAKTLYGNDETHSRRECKLKYGCRILRRDSEAFANTYDLVIRPLDYDKKLLAMDLISVSSIMKVKQSTEYIKRLLMDYGKMNVYFADLEGVEEYSNYKEAQK